uniref:ATP synthase F0 subunit 8 n=1 Tax=Cerion incanum TaxID=145432 RepID=A0A0A0R2G2_9EUPU|nr:ATP synthase F0 subunit 8 [Cerion incanum]AIU94466.1 ATP synthase F0 subunit 8 [Cerion incanum]
MPQLSPHNALAYFLIMSFLILCLSISLSYSSPKVMVCSHMKGAKTYSSSQTNPNLLFT